VLSFFSKLDLTAGLLCQALTTPAVLSFIVCCCLSCLNVTFLSPPVLVSEHFIYMLSYLLVVDCVSDGFTQTKHLLYLPQGCMTRWFSSKNIVYFEELDGLTISLSKIASQHTVAYFLMTCDALGA